MRDIGHQLFDSCPLPLHPLRGRFLSCQILAKLALQPGKLGLIIACLHEGAIDGIRQHFIFITCWGAARSAAGFCRFSLLFDMFQYFFIIFSGRRRLDKFNNIFNFIIGNKTALDALRLAFAKRRIKHIAFANEFFRTCGIQNDTAFDLGRDRKRNAGRDICFHNASDYIG